MSVNVLRNCGSGGTATGYVYIVAAGKFTSAISQDDADRQADEDIQQHAQRFADSLGTCVWTNAVNTRTYTRNNCGTGNVGGTYDYTVAAGKYSSNISQADADAQAEQEQLANGQARANTYGTCTYYSAAFGDDFNKDDCLEGEGELVHYALPQGAYSSTISQADANQKARNAVYADGQAYANANGNCIFFNNWVDGPFQKNDCTGGSTGSLVYYYVEPGTYISTISQEDADQMAIAALNAGGQAYANANGTCAWYNAAYGKNFVKNNCSSNGNGSTVYYEVPAGIYTSTISQADADQKAIDAVNYDGQEYANINGTCIPIPTNVYAKIFC